MKKNSKNTGVSLGKPAWTRTDSLSKSKKAKTSIAGERRSSKKKLMEEEIRLKAYYNYLARGTGDGYDKDDWYKAEREVKGK